MLHRHTFLTFAGSYSGNSSSVRWPPPAIPRPVFRALHRSIHLNGCGAYSTQLLINQLLLIFRQQVIQLHGAEECRPTDWCFHAKARSIAPFHREIWTLGLLHGVQTSKPSRFVSSPYSEASKCQRWNLVVPFSNSSSEGGETCHPMVEPSLKIDIFQSIVIFALVAFTK